MGKRIPTEEKLRLRCETLVEVVKSVSPLYRAGTLAPTQRDFVETIIGAAIWYLPDRGMWTGRISRALVESFHPERGEARPRESKDHIVPRKAAAQRLLMTDWNAVSNPAAYLESLYKAELGKYHCITPWENKQLVNMHLVGGGNWEQAYGALSIATMEVTLGEFKKVKKRDRQVIEGLISRFPAPHPSPFTEVRWEASPEAS